MVSCGALIRTCEKVWQWQASQELLQGLAHLLLTPSAVKYSEAIITCEKRKQWKEAILLSGAAINSREKGEQWEGALELLQAMVHQ